jgi:UDP-GlcNAc:undecaprenyl-phosphate GlcNAc-1-phosphate transferase
LILFGFPVLDTLTVMFSRIAKGGSPFAADKSHFHHKLMTLGLYHTEAVFVIYVIQAMLVSAAFLFRFHSDWLLFGGYLVFCGLILTGQYLSYRTGWRFKRYDVIDLVIKGRLRKLKEKGILIKVSFGAVEALIPTILLFSCFIPASVPRYFSVFFLSLAVLVLAVWIGKKEWVSGLLRLVIYLCIPVVIYLGQRETAGWMSADITRLYNLSFGLVTLLSLIVVRFTRRKRGFHFYPLDFLVLFLALVVSNLPAASFQMHRSDMPLLAVKLIVLFYGYEILVGELRGEVKGLGVTTIIALAVLGARGWVG